jgi:5-methylcytosine-specific restriction endonuclease McrA
MKANMFILNSSFTHNTIKNNLVKNNLIPYECATCKNQGKHNGLKLTLQLDHINGNKKDQRLSNLRFLCPNCHSQTETYAGGNRKIVKSSQTA